MSLSDVDRQLLQRCLDHDPKAWQDFSDRFLGLVLHVVHRTTSGRGVPIDAATQDDLVSEVFLTLLLHDMSVLRQFRRGCSLATYLTIIARRVIVRRMVQWDRQSVAAGSNGHSVQHESVKEGNGQLPDPASYQATDRLEDIEQLQQLMLRLDPREASVVRMFHLEGKSYEEISRATGVSTNSIGPMLHRARNKMND